MLYISGLKKKYKGNVTAVDIDKLVLKSGQITCLIGPSGCGKTSLLKLINKLIEPSSGLIEINGLKSHEAPAEKWRRKIGYVIQGSGLLPHLTAIENISLLPKALKRDKKQTQKRAEELLKLTGLNPKQYKDRYPIELSGGQRQRIGIARALMEDPPLLLMDEPFGSLDPKSRALMKRELKKIHRRLKKTILMVTHDIREAFDLGEKVILMRRGSIEQEGRKKEDFKKKPASPFVLEFIDSAV